MLLAYTTQKEFAGVTTCNKLQLMCIWLHR